MGRCGAGEVCMRREQVMEWGREECEECEECFTEEIRLRGNVKDVSCGLEDEGESGSGRLWMCTMGSALGNLWKSSKRDTSNG